MIDHFPQAKVVGLTATPDRGDGVAMGRLFESTAHVYGIRDGIRDGFLCRVKQKAVEIEGFDLREVRTTAGDLNEGDLERLLLDPDLLQRIAGAIVEAAGDRKTMVFCVTVAHAHALAATLNGFEPESSRALDGGSDGELRRQTLQDFADDKFKRLCNCQLFTEGFDEPSISCVAVTRPTKSRAFYAQMVGRGFRVFKGKADCLILDFQGNAGKHTLACPIDILGGADVDPAVKKKAAAAMAERPDLDLLTALEMAARELAAERRAKALSLAQFRAVDVDPFELADAVLGGANEAAESGDGDALADNLRYLAENAGGLRADAMKPSQVAAVAGALKARQEAGRATWAQMRCLQRAGLDPDVDFETAAEAIRTLAATGWQATPALRARIDAARVRSAK